MKARPQQKVVVVNSFYKKQLQTDGTTVFSYMDLEIPQAMEWGPYLESVQVHTNTENKTTNFTWKLVLYWSIDGRQWNVPVDLFSAISNNGGVIQIAYTTNTQFGLYMRYAIGVANGSGTAIERAVCTAALAFTFKS